MTLSLPPVMSFGMSISTPRRSISSSVRMHTSLTLSPSSFMPQSILKMPPFVFLANFVFQIPNKRSLSRLVRICTGRLLFFMSTTEYLCSLRRTPMGLTHCSTHQRTLAGTLAGTVQQGMGPPWHHRSMNAGPAPRDVVRPVKPVESKENCGTSRHAWCR